MDIFIDRSILEIFANSEICLTQRIYPTHEDSKHFSLFTNDAAVDVIDIQKWEMDQTHIDHLKSLGLWEDDTYDGSEYISKT